ncbi:MAG: hypothetical protein ABIH25_05345 [Candidatus Woesearchaeota archaeon]
MRLEERIDENGTELPVEKKSVVGRTVDFALRGYERMHSSYPLVTNYLSSAVGTVGGDAIAKQFTDNPDVTPRDVAFTATAAIAYSYLAPKMIEWSTKATNKVSESWKALKSNKTTHTLFNTSLLTAMYFPVNMVYWNYLTVKNQAPITLEDNLAGAITLGIATIPYLAADYVAIKKFSQPKTQKWLRPFYSVVEIAWNTLFAGGNYLAKKP